jgi:hypothetical protein
MARRRKRLDGTDGRATADRIALTRTGSEDIAWL